MFDQFKSFAYLHTREIDLQLAIEVKRDKHSTNWFIRGCYLCIALFIVCVLCIRENVIFKSCQNIRGNHFNGATCKCIQLARKSSNRNVGFGLESFWLLS